MNYDEALRQSDVLKAEINLAIANPNANRESDGAIQPIFHRTEMLLVNLYRSFPTDLSALRIALQKETALYSEHGNSKRLKVLYEFLERVDSDIRQKRSLHTSNLKQSNAGNSDRKLNFGAAIREIDSGLADIGQRINAPISNQQYNLERISDEIGILLSGVFSKEQDSELAVRWISEYHKSLIIFKRYGYEQRIFKWSEFLKTLKRDLERRQRIQNHENEVSPDTIGNEKSFRLPFYILLLVLLSSWIWMIPPLVEKSDWFWQMVAQILASSVIGATYFDFNRRKWFTAVGVALLAVVLVMLFQQNDIKQQLTAGAWLIIWTVCAAGIWELIKWTKK